MVENSCFALLTISHLHRTNYQRKQGLLGGTKLADVPFKVASQTILSQWQLLAHVINETILERYSEDIFQNLAKGSYGCLSEKCEGLTAILF